VGGIATFTVAVLDVTSAISTGIAIVHTRIHDEM
jgi:hypothetical protein